MPKVPGHGAGGAASCVTARLLECDAGTVKLITHETSLGLAEQPVYSDRASGGPLAPPTDGYKS